jgi:hypothetical protein
MMKQEQVLMVWFVEIGGVTREADAEVIGSGEEVND